MPSGFLLLAAAAAALGWASWRFWGGYPRPGRRLEALAPRELALVTAVSEAMFPEGGAIPPSGAQAGVPAYVDGYVARVPATVRLLMRLLFILVEHATVLWPGPGAGGRRRLSAQSVEQRVAVLEGWRTSGWFPRRLVFTSLRAILCMGYLADPGVLRHLGLAPYDFPSPVLEPDLLYPPAGQPRGAIRFGEADLTPPSDGTPLPLDGPLHPDYREVSS